jgi:hypothetical protein
MRHDPLSSDLCSLIDAPSPATITLYGEDGEAITSPVWFRLDGQVFEAVRPFRGLQVRASASIAPDEESRVRLAIASHYLGPEAGRA